jgi:hypothetical protein
MELSRPFESERRYSPVIWDPEAMLEVVAVERER